jgi:hypothetical protein
MPKVDSWPVLFVKIRPTTLDQLRRDAEIRALPVSVIVRETLDKAVKEGG